MHQTDPIHQRLIAEMQGENKKLRRQRDAAREQVKELHRQRDDARTQRAIMTKERAEMKARAEAAEAALRIANRGGLDLLYAIREAIGWTDKHALSLLPEECRRLKAASGTKRGQHAPIWPGKGYDHSQPGGFDGPTGAD